MQRAAGIAILTVYETARDKAYNIPHPSPPYHSRFLSYWCKPVSGDVKTLNGVRRTYAMEMTCAFVLNYVPKIQEVFGMQERFNEAPETTSYFDADQSRFVVEFSMMEVQKESISLMVFENGCSLFAPSSDSNYVALVPFPCPVDPSKATAIFDSGYLKVEAPLKDGLGAGVKLTVEEPS
jgi:HSP20 family molecular chaperone IbpA